MKSTLGIDKVTDINKILSILIPSLDISQQKFYAKKGATACEKNVKTCLVMKDQRHLKCWVSANKLITIKSADTAGSFCECFCCEATSSLITT